MKRFLLLPLLLISFSLFSQDLRTPFERSGGTMTGTYEEVIAFYKELDASNPLINMVPMGPTDSGYPLHLVIYDADGQFDPVQARENGKTIMLINNGIHPGEPDGIEASMMFLRDLVTGESSEDLSEIYLAIIPIYNIGGALNRNSYTRANQNGPEAYGFRGNAQNRDLNRDFIKMDTRNASSFAGIFHYLDPDVFIDTHVSNGADYQYSITHLATQPDKLNGDLGNYMQNEMIPQLEQNMKSLDSEIIPYVNSFGTTPDKGYGIFFDAPRYSTGYTALFNTLGFMIETHMLKPFDLRVNSTYRFFQAMCRIIVRDSHKIRKMRSEVIGNMEAKDMYTITWGRDRESFREIEFKGYEGRMVESPFGGERLFYDREKPFTKQVPYYDRFSPGIQVKVPEAYIIPQGWHKVLERLEVNQVEMIPLQQDTVIEVEAYRIGSVEYSRGPYEGHFLHRSVNTTSSVKKMTFRKGDVIIPVKGRSMRYIIEVLEPEATDSFFRWNFFDSILQQKEYFSSYVFEDVAIRMLEEDPELRERFEKEKESNEDMASNRRRQLDWIYRNSPYYEPAHMSYPVYRINR